jgi:hypothetical protein
MRRSTTALVLGLALLACADDEPGPAINQGTLHDAFEAASAATGVPKDLLLAIGYYETRWMMVQPEVFADPNDEAPGGHAVVDDGFRHGWGIMQLESRDGHDTLGLAAQLTGRPADLLKTDVALNIEGAARVLRHYADETFAGAELSEVDLLGWRDVLATWSGLDDMDEALAVTEEIYAILREGAGRTLDSGEVLELLPNPGLAEPQAPGAGGAESGFWGVMQGAVDYGDAHWKPAASSNFTSGRGGNRVRYIVIHTMQGSYAGSISWLRNPASKVSAHYCVRSRDGDVTQMVDEADTGWHAGNWSYNQQSVGIEHEGWVADAAWYTDAMYRSSARLACDIARRHGVPVDRQHIIGHDKVPGATHTDPGRYWNWDYYLGLIRECVGTDGGTTGGGTTGGGTDEPPPPIRSGNGTLQGVVYVDGNLNHRLGQASVRLSNGLTTTTANNGAFSFSVPAGQYTVTASASGYANGTVSRTVVAGGNAWGSVGLRSLGGAPQSGRIEGVIFRAGSPSTRIAGARISGGGASTTTDDAGRYVLVVPPGPHRLDFRADGHLGKTISATVQNGQTRSLNVGMVPNGGNPGGGTSGGGTSGGGTSGSETSGGGTSGGGTSGGGTSGSETSGAGTSGAGTSGGGTSVDGTSGGEGWLVGVVYESPNGLRRIAGATVTFSNGTTLTTGPDGYYRIRAKGTVTIVGSAPGYHPQSVSRRIPAGSTVWGSIGLSKGVGGAKGGGLAAQCKPTAPKTPHNPPQRVVPITFGRGEEPTTNTPTLEFTGCGDPTASYILRLLPSGPGATPLEYLLPPGDPVRFTIPTPLAPGGYTWAALAIWPDCTVQDLPDSWGFFYLR